MNKVNKHIGIAACSSEGAVLCYRTICLEGQHVLGKQMHPEVTMRTFPLSTYTERILQDDWSGVADLILASSEKLRQAGADILICPDNTVHQAFPFLIKQSPLTWLHIAE
jgi:aspartate racemase